MNTPNDASHTPTVDTRRDDSGGIWELAKRIAARRAAERGRSRRRGMTLVEIMVVIILIAGIGTALAVTIFGALGENEQRLATIQLDKLSEQLDAFYLSHREYPDSLTRLVEADYISEDMLNDPWGQEINYAVTGRRSYELCSPGEGESICKTVDRQRGGR